MPDTPRAAEPAAIPDPGSLNRATGQHPSRGPEPLSAAAPEIDRPGTSGEQVRNRHSSHQQIRRAPLRSPRAMAALGRPAPPGPISLRAGDRLPVQVVEQAANRSRTGREQALHPCPPLSVEAARHDPLEARAVRIGPIR